MKLSHKWQLWDYPDLNVDLEMSHGLRIRRRERIEINLLHYMADTVPQKRILPARERRESAAKRRDLSPPRSPVATPKKSTPSKAQTPKAATDPTRVKRKYTKRASLIQVPSRDASSPASDIALPTKVTDTRPLPTTRSKQADNLSIKEYQSIAESAILASSLFRSRVQWLCDGIFEKYWTKPVKRKGITEAMPNNPDAKTMQKLGHCTVTIEPHVFEAVFYTVKEPQGPLVSYQPMPLQPIQQAPPPSGAAPPPHYGPGLALHPASTSTPLPPSNVKQESETRPDNFPPSTNPPSTTSAASPTNRRQSDTRLSSRQQISGPPQSPKANTDPVIQMLASRAATDSKLKELMKVVATSKASPDQLKEFQRHIDEFNVIIKRQDTQRERRSSDAQRKQIESNQNALPQLEGSSTRPPQPGPPLTPTHPSMYSAPIPPSNPPPPRSSLNPPPYSIYSHPQPPPPPPQRLEPRIKHIVLEFTTPATQSHPASQDRYLFPDHAVLEIPHSAGGFEMLASFFVERKGSDLIRHQQHHPDPFIESARWDPKKEYYEPVTLKLRAMQHKTLRTIATAARTLPDVQAYMEEVMRKKSRAPSGFLVMRLPREGVAADERGRDSGIEIDDSEADEEVDDELRGWYGNV